MRYFNCPPDPIKYFYCCKSIASVIYLDKIFNFQDISMNVV